MIWLTWRQFRTQFVAAYALVMAASVVLLITGRKLRDLVKGKSNIYDLVSSTDHTLFVAGITVMAVAPAIIGIFWGAPLVARELETGTHRLVWNQSVTRTRWLAMKLGVTIVATAVAIGILTAAVSWWAHPLDGALGSTRGSFASRLTPVAFAMRGIVPVGYAVFAVVLGATLGIVLRRSLPAMAVTLAIYTVVQIAVPIWVRPHLVAPVSASVVISQKTLDSIQSNNDSTYTITAHTASPKDWILSNETVDAKGNAASLPAWFKEEDCLPPPPSASAGTVQAKPASDLDTCLTRLTREGYRQHITYQPAGHFWRLQLTEAAMFAGISALLIGFAFWWTRRKVS